jgi:hypothetical protein
MSKKVYALSRDVVSQFVGRLPLEVQKICIYNLEKGELSVPDAYVSIADAIDLRDLPTRILLDYASARRFALEIAGITFEGFKIATDRAGQSMVLGAWALAQQDASISVRWKTADAATWAIFDVAKINALARAVGAHVEACFSAEAQITADIRRGSITTTVQIDQTFTQLMSA